MASAAEILKKSRKYGSDYNTYDTSSKSKSAAEILNEQRANTYRKQLSDINIQSIYDNTDFGLSKVQNNDYKKRISSYKSTLEKLRQYDFSITDDDYNKTISSLDSLSNRLDVQSQYKSKQEYEYALINKNMQNAKRLAVIADIFEEKNNAKEDFISRVEKNFPTKKLPSLPKTNIPQTFTEKAKSSIGGNNYNRTFLPRESLSTLIDKSRTQGQIESMKNGGSLWADNQRTEDLERSYWDTYTDEDNYNSTPILKKYEEYKVLGEKPAKILSYLDSNGLTNELKKYKSFLEYEKDKLENELHYQGKVLKYATDTPAAIGESVLSVPANLVGGVLAEGSNIVQAAVNASGYGDGRINVYDGWHDLANYAINVRGAVTENIDSDLGKFLYQTGMSMADSAVVATMSAGLGRIGVPTSTAVKLATIPLASSAANQTTRSMIEEGYTPKQAFRMGVASGFAEYLTEQYSIEGLLKGNSIAKQAFAEGSEEVTSNVLNRIFEAGILGTQSHNNRLLESYIAQGLSKKDAYIKVLQNNLYDDFTAFAGGALSGGLMSAGVKGMQYATTVKTLGETVIQSRSTIDEIKKIALSLDKDSAAYKYVSKFGNNITSKQLGKAILLIDEYSKNEKKDVIYNAVYRKAIELGASVAEAKAIADYRVGIETQQFTTAEELVKSFNKAVSSTAGIRISDAIYGNSKNTEDTLWATGLANKLKNVESIEEKLKNALDTAEQVETTTTPQKESKETKNAYTQQFDYDKKTAENTTDNTQKKQLPVSDTGNTVNSTTGEEIKISGVAAISRGKTVLTLENGKQIDSNNVKYANATEAELYANIGTVTSNAEAANKIIAEYNADNGLSVNEYLAGMKQGYEYGSMGLPINNMDSDLYFHALTPAQQNTAYSLGEIFGNERAKAKQEAVNEKVSSGKKKGVQRKGKVIFEGSAEEEYNKIKDKKDDTSKRQQLDIITVEKIVSDITHNTVHLYNTYVNEDGVRCYADDSKLFNKGEPAENGIYNSATGDIWIDLYAGDNGEGIILWTFAHEVVHFASDFSPEEYRNYAKWLVKIYGEKGANLDDLINRKVNSAKRKGRTLTRKQALEEVVANYSQKMLTDTDLMSKMEQLKTQDKNLWEKIKELFTKLQALIKEHYEKLNPQTDEAAMFEKLGDRIDTAVDMFAKMLVSAGNAYENIDMSEANKNADIIRLSERNDVESIKSQIKDNLNTLNSMNVVASVKELTTLKDNESTLKWALNRLKNTGYKVDRQGFGKIIIDDKRISNGLRYLKTNEERLAFAVVPQVLKRGVMIDEAIDHKHRRYDTITFAAPVVINGQRGNLAVVVRQEGKNYYKVHRILSPDGTLFEIKNRDTAERAGGIVNDSGLSPADNVSIDSISQNTEKSQVKYSERNSKSEYEKLNAELHELYKEDVELKEKISEFTKASEHQNMLSALSDKNLTDEELTSKLNDYEKWESESGFAEVAKKLSENTGREKDIRAKIQAYEDEQRNALKKQIESFSDEEIKKYVAAAKKRYGVTYDLKKAAYLLPDGSMLDFSDGQRDRVKDHREITEVLDLPDYAGYSDGMIAFMNMGNIRLQTYGIDISAMPTDKQISALRGFINKLDGEFTVDFSRKNGDSEASIDYPMGTSSSKIISDIKNYFENGVVPEVNNSLNEFLFSERNTDYTKELERKNRQLEKENAIYKEDLKDIKELLKLQKKQTHGKMITKSSVDILAKKLVNKYDADTSIVKAVSERMYDLYSYIQAGEDVSEEEIRERSQPIIDMLENNKKVHKGELNDYAKEIYRQMKGKKVYVSPELKAEANYLNDKNGYNQLRKGLLGWVTLTSNPSDISLDSQWKEWAELFPATFDNEINEKDMLTTLGGIVEQLRNTKYQADFDYADYAGFYADEIKQQYITDIKEGFWNAATLHTVADKYAKEIIRLKVKHQNQFDKLRQMQTEKIAELREEQKQRLAEYRNQAIAKQEKLIEKYNKRIEDARERRNLTAVRGKIKRLWAKMDKMFRNPTDISYIPADLRNAVLEALTALDIRTGKTNKTQTALNNLYNAYQRLLDSKDEDLKAAYDEQIGRALFRIKDTLAGRNIYDQKISLDMLNDIYDCLNSLYGQVMDAKNLIGENEKMTIRESGNKIIDEQDEIHKTLSPSKVKKLLKGVDDKSSFFFLSSMRAILKMSNFKTDAELNRLFIALNEGLKKKYDFKMLVSKKLDALVKTKEGQKAFESAIKDVIDFGWGKMTKMQAAQIVLVLERESDIGTKHIAKGGASITNSKYHDNVEKRRDSKTLIKHDTLEMMSDIREVLAKDKWMQDYIEVAKEILRVDTKNAINSASRLLKHRDIATDKFYIPFVTDNTFTVHEIEGLVYDATIEGSGAFKNTTKGASNALYIEGLDIVLERAINTAADYYGLAVPIRNINRALNVKNDESGKSVKDSITKNWKSTGMGIIDKTLTDIQTPRKNDRLAIVDTLKSAFIASTLNGNIGVAIKQAASLDVAFAKLNYRNPAFAWAEFAKTVKNYDSIINEIDEHTSEHWRRRIGLSTDEVATMAKEGGFVGKINKKIPSVIHGDKWIQMIDCWTTATIWSFAKQDISKDIKSGKYQFEVGSDEYWNAVTKLYEDTIESTQPMYDALHRSEMQKNNVSNKIFMFKTQPLQNAGMLYEAAHGYMTAKAIGDTELAQKYKRQLKKTIGVQSQSAITFAIMTFIASAIKGKVKRYKDDDDELTLASVIKRLGMDVGGTATGLFIPLGGQELFNYIDSHFISKTGFNNEFISLPVVDWLDNYASKISAVYNKPSLESIGRLVTALGDITGQPATNYYNLIHGIGYNIKDIVNGDFMQFEASEDQTTSHLLKRAHGAFERGETQELNEYIQEAIQAKVADGKTEKEAKSAIRSSLTSKYKPIFLEAYKSKDEKTMVSIRKFLTATGIYGSGFDVVDTTQDWIKKSK